MGRDIPLRTPGPATGYPETAGSLLAQSLRASEGFDKDLGENEPDRARGARFTFGAGETAPDDI